MTANGLAAITILGIGLLGLLIWMYLTSGNPRSQTILRRSVAYIVAPSIALAITRPLVAPWPFIVTLSIGVFLEELIKLVASRSERVPVDAFWMVCLFGLFELAAGKSLIALGTVGLNGRADVALMVATAIVPVLMHGFTGAVYAFCGRSFPAGQLLACWLLHMVYNVIAFEGVAWLYPVGGAFFLAGILFLWPKRSAPSDSSRGPTIGKSTFHP